MATKSWSNPVNGSFTNAANWSSGSIPGPGDDAVIGVAGAYIVSLTAPITVQSITVSGPSATLSVADRGGTESVTAI